MDPGTLRRTTKRVIRMTQPAAVVAVFRNEDCDRRSAMRLAAAAGIGAVTLEQDALEHALRETLTDLARLPRAFRQWLRIAGVTAEERLVLLLGGIVGAVARQWEPGGRACAGDQARSLSVEQMANTVELTARGLRDAFARSGLPSPVQWKILARDLVHALIIQREAGKPLTRLAMSLGYADSQALSRAFHQGFGVTPSFARERLGWQWLALRWSEKQAGDQNRQSTAVFDHVSGPPNSHFLRQQDRGVRTPRQES
jgi:AraC-like DNA-binding protein